MTDLATDLQYFLAAVLGQSILWGIGVMVAASFIVALIVALGWSTRSIKF